MGFPAVWKTADDEAQILLRTGAELRYPYATLFHAETQFNHERGNTQASSRRGAYAIVSDDQRRQYKVMYLPVDFRVDVKILEDSAQRARVHLHRALFAIRQGWFKFSYTYGANSFDVSCTGPDMIVFPKAISDQDASKVYEIEFQLVLGGHISESVLREEQIIDSVQVSTYVGDGEIENSDLAFPPQVFTHSSDTSKEPK